ncbi:hypothetical protein CANARDRAFT_175910 [[Candida] arabinofermentans NRRL YB-2248]|uniref:TECPR1-like DysF domain-containing protein n=1 Tax=[Candida] arabinofermentans NRRL YB-2248 TaxID=983967 RepID=A0A1E4T114_9ASCO|nr:hypothetical protein CANARDRAFT_175910 [[Candida] arabinofermentans NRRL YB-2248]
MAVLLSSLSSIGLDKLSADEVKQLEDMSDDQKVEKTHFMDMLVGRMVDQLSSKSNDESIMTLKDRLNDSHRVERPALSITKIVSNFKKLSAKMDIVFAIQYFVIHFVSWDEPTLTITVLILYTWGCIHPFLFLVYPLLAIVYAIMIPSYLYRHPIDTPKLNPTRIRGDPIPLGFLKSDNEWEINRKELEIKRKQELEELLKSDLISVSSRTSIDSDTDDGGAANVLYDLMTADSKTNFLFSTILKEDEENQKNSKGEDDSPEVSKSKGGVVGKIKLLTNMRDLQNLTTDIIKMMNNFEKLVHENCSFIDEKKSTRLFINFLFLIFIISFLGPFIPWRFIIIVTAWVAILMNHPGRKEFLEQFTSTETAKIIENKTRNESKTPRQLKAERRIKYLTSMIVDDPPQYRKVQVFEIEKQNITKPQLYEQFIYSDSIFNMSDECRLQRKKPTGVSSLSLIDPPSSNWQFVSDSKWSVDDAVEDWCIEYNVLKEVRIDGSWAYDENGEYRRRRLIRDVVRYSRQAKSFK